MTKIPTLDETANLYFGQEPSEKECVDCASKKDINVLYTTEFGASTWICKNCRARREAAQRESERREAERMKVWDEMDEWEEG